MHPLVWILFIIGVIIRVVSLPLVLVGSVLSLMIGIMLRGLTGGAFANNQSSNSPSTNAPSTISPLTGKIIGVIYNIWFYYIFAALYFEKASNYIVGIGVSLELLLIIGIYIKLRHIIIDAMDRASNSPNTPSAYVPPTEVPSIAPYDLMYYTPSSAPSSM